MIRWNFTADVRKTFLYDRYPLDRQDIWLRMRPAETETLVTLTPDLAAYPSLTPSTKPGLTPSLVLEGWYPVQTYFSYATTAASTTFGDERGAREAEIPELYYTVTVKRDLIVPFLTYLFPVLIIAVMLFFGLMISTKELERRAQIGWNVAGILSYSAALLFVALLAHINMRSVVGAEDTLHRLFLLHPLRAHHADIAQRGAVGLQDRVEVGHPRRQPDPQGALLARLSWLHLHPDGSGPSLFDLRSL